jgi:hypothetical protein
MSYGFCVLGIERSQNAYRSLRPIPPGATRWESFPFERGDRVAFEFSPLPTMQPHIEDRCARQHRKVGALTEVELVGCLKQAEVAEKLSDLFSCRLNPSPYRGQSKYVNPDDAARSICGCAINTVRFSFRFYPESLRVEIELASGETLRDLPVVDRDWRRFVCLLGSKLSSEDGGRSNLGSFFKSFIEGQITSSPSKFARIGISRPFNGDRCWLMLDSLFPLPQPHWLSQFS